jgi:hypothetical protein
MTETETHHSIAVGQVWLDDDPRASGRRIEIIEVDEVNQRARGKVLSTARNVSDAAVGRRTRWIQFRRFRPGNRGYRLAPRAVE